jgi:hypothetical protein
MDARGEIETLMQTSGFSRSKLLGLLKEMMPAEPKREPGERKRKEPAPPTTVYKEERYSSIVKLTKGEDTAVLTAEGKVHIINSDSPAEIECVSSSCNWCASFIHKMDRNELEQRYMTLLSMVSLVGKANPFGNKITVAGSDSDWRGVKI